MLKNAKSKRIFKIASYIILLFCLMFGAVFTKFCYRDLLNKVWEV